MRICTTCYQKALVKRQDNEGLTCDLDPTHGVGSCGLKKHPLNRTITQADGTERLMRICHACYQKAMVKRQDNEGLTCDLDPTHGVGSCGLKKDPLKRTITQADGTERLMRICASCYKKALKEKQKSDGLTCDLDPTHGVGSWGLSKHPLHRTITQADGTKKLMRICNACYRKALKEKQQQKSFQDDQPIPHVEDSEEASEAVAKTDDAKEFAIQALLGLGN
jgi:hypothetical protein